MQGLISKMQGSYDRWMYRMYHRSYAEVARKWWWMKVSQVLSRSCKEVMMNECITCLISLLQGSDAECMYHRYYSSYPEIGRRIWVSNVSWLLYKSLRKLDSIIGRMALFYGCKKNRLYHMYHTCIAYYVR